MIPLTLPFNGDSYSATHDPGERYFDDRINQCWPNINIDEIFFIKNLETFPQRVINKNQNNRYWIPRHELHQQLVKDVTFGGHQRQNVKCDEISKNTK